MDHKLKLLHSEEVKGSVTAMSAINGYLLTCVGTKVVVRSFEDNETLTGIAFIDVQIYVTNVKVVKNTIMLADAYKSVWFIGFQDEPTKPVLLGKDYHPMEATNVCYLIEGQTLQIAVSDSEKNIRLLQYAPFNVQSFSGQKLICRGDYHIGSQIQSTISVPKIVLSGSDEGIRTQIVNGVHAAGLNPRAFRLLQSKDRLNYNPVKGILDGDLLFEFIGLPANRQKEMTKQIGTGVDRIMDDLAGIASTITLHDIKADNREAITKLLVNRDQLGLVPRNLESLCEHQFYTPRSLVRAIVADNIPVGYIRLQQQEAEQGNLQSQRSGSGS
ncbi:hypothetical protein BGZ65_005382 [Modicella reniformis]|uniref:RSE1/DDB1/CPSF1 C-terminal domain-containing protein n=1 Tax=Modicella reniformis TaxID=1440133 RepID=A0A9P6LS96_9FUNG|nr:hypothetical protein BGZ65_005382 [Modicella reniformis]